MPPAQQGHLSHLCGLYAVFNGIEYVLSVLGVPFDVEAQADKFIDEQVPGDHFKRYYLRGMRRDEQIDLAKRLIASLDVPNCKFILKRGYADAKLPPGLKLLDCVNCQRGDMKNNASVVLWQYAKYHRKVLQESHFTVLLPPKKKDATATRLSAYDSCLQKTHYDLNLVIAADSAKSDTGVSYESLAVYRLTIHKTD